MRRAPRHRALLVPLLAIPLLIALLVGCDARRAGTAGEQEAALAAATTSGCTYAGKEYSNGAQMCQMGYVVSCSYANWVQQVPQEPCSCTCDCTCS